MRWVYSPGHYIHPVRLIPPSFGIFSCPYLQTVRIHLYILHIVYCVFINVRLYPPASREFRRTREDQINRRLYIINIKHIYIHTLILVLVACCEQSLSMINKSSEFYLFATPNTHHQPLAPGYNRLFN